MPSSRYSRYHVRIVSSSSSSTLATASQLIPSSSSTSALARRASRCGADPSRANSIRSCRDSRSSKPLRIIKPAESHENDSGSGFFGYPRNRDITRVANGPRVRLKAAGGGTRVAATTLLGQDMQQAGINQPAEPGRRDARQPTDQGAEAYGTPQTVPY